jgi:hypothetical protein
MLADELDRLFDDAADFSPEIRARWVRTQRRAAECHLLAGILQAAHAWRLRNWAEDEDTREIVPPVFLSTVAAFTGVDSASVSLFLFDHKPAVALLAASNQDARAARIRVHLPRRPRTRPRPRRRGGQRGRARPDRALATLRRSSGAARNTRHRRGSAPAGRHPLRLPRRVRPDRRRDSHPDALRDPGSSHTYPGPDTPCPDVEPHPAATAVRPPAAPMINASGQCGNRCAISRADCAATPALSASRRCSSAPPGSSWASRS